MNKSFKAGLLIVTLVIPALIFAFLQFFGTNHYNLPYITPERNASGQVMVVQGDTLFRKLDVISLEQSAGTSYKLAGKLTVVHYLPQSCKDSCELIIAQLERVTTLENAIPELNLLTLTDMPEGSNMTAQKTDVPRWHTLRGSENNIVTWLESNAKSVVVPEQRLVLFDDQGYARGLYNGSNPSEIDRLMAEIKILDYEKRKTKE